jgi:hypothetical protein
MRCDAPDVTAQSDDDKNGASIMLTHAALVHYQMVRLQNTYIDIYTQARNSFCKNSGL